MTVTTWPFKCDCDERGVPEEFGCDSDHCPCWDCHSQVHAAASDAICCKTFGAWEVIVS